MMSLELYIKPSSYLQLIVGTLITIVLSQIPAMHFISRLDLAKSAKEVM